MLFRNFLEPGPGSLEEKLNELRTFAVERLVNLRGLLLKPENVHQARAVLAEQFGKITLVPDKGMRTYSAKGSVDFFGNMPLQTGCAGGPDSTTRRAEFELSLAA